MTGTIINVFTVLVGGALGMMMGNRMPERFRQTIISGLGLFMLALGMQMFLQTKNALVVLISLLLGAVLGEWWQIEAGLAKLGRWLEQRFMREQDTNLFVKGFLTASLVFCVGPMAILGSIQDGLAGDYHTLAVKAVIDGFAALAFASSLGVGVLFSALIILAYQGGLTLLAVQVQNLMTQPMMTEMTAVGGVMILGIAFSGLLEIRQIRVGNFLPALVIAPLMVAVLVLLGIY